MQRRPLAAQIHQGYAHGWHDTATTGMER
jgi:hypothetical protein